MPLSIPPLAVLRALIELGRTSCRSARQRYRRSVNVSLRLSSKSQNVRKFAGVYAGVLTACDIVRQLQRENGARPFFVRGSEAVEASY